MGDAEYSNWQTYGFSVCSCNDVLSPHSPLSAWNLACGFAQNESQLLAFRFLSGLGGSAPLVVCVTHFGPYHFQ